MHVRIALALLFTIGITVACGDDSQAPTAPTQVTPPAATRTVEAVPIVAERLVITGSADFLDNRELEVGQTVQLRADLEMSDDSVRENVAAEWSSSNTTVATIDSSGLVTARQAGGFDIRATAEGLTARLTGVSAVLPPQPNRSPTVAVSCDPCEVEVDNEVRLRANASDPDNDPLSYGWSAPRGRFIGSTSEATARWRAPDQEGSVQITVRVTDGRGGSVAQSVTVRVNPAAPDHPPVREFRNCTEMRGAGWNRGVNRNGGTYRSSWNDAERRTYNLNTKSDRDNDGHACET